MIKKLQTQILSYFCTTLALSLALSSPILSETKLTEKKDGIDTAAVVANQQSALAVARLVPKDVMQAKTGSIETDNIFSNFSLRQIQLILREYEKKLELSRLRKQKITRTSLTTAEQFLKVFPDSKVADEISIRYADLYYEKVTEEFYAQRSPFDSAQSVFTNSEDYKEYDKKYLNWLGEGADEATKPKLPDSAPVAPDPKLDEVIAVYDHIINDMPQSAYVADALYGKAFILGERYSDYSAYRKYQSQRRVPGVKELTPRDIEDKRREAISVLGQIIRRFPESRYIVDAYMLTGEYYFNSRRNQPKPTKDAIPYFRKAMDLIIKRGERSEYFNQALYKLGWSYYRLGEFSQAIVYFTQLVDEIEKAEEIFEGSILPDYVRTDMKDEAMEYIVACFVKIQEAQDRSKTAIALLDNYFGSLPRKRYAPLIYEMLGDKYKQKLESSEKIVEVFTTLIRRYPNYERAPFAANEIIDQYYGQSRNGEKLGRELEEIEQRIYEERKNLFYSYGRSSPWFKDLQRRMEAVNSGKVLPFEQQSVRTSGFDPMTLTFADSISKKVLFDNIRYGIDQAALLDGSEPSIPENKSHISEYPKEFRDRKAKEFYEQVVKDVESYTSFFSAYDQKAFWAQFQRAQILDYKLGRTKEAIPSYLSIAKNFAYDSMRLDIEDETSPVISFRRESLKQAFGYSDSVCKAMNLAIYTPGLDTLARFSGEPLPIREEEKLFLDIADTYIRLYPHDSLSVNLIKVVSDFYIAKVMLKEYREANSRLVQYYPIQTIYSGTVYNLMDNAFFVEKDYGLSERLAKAVYYGPNTGDPKWEAQKRDAYEKIGYAIGERAKYYNSKGNYAAAGREYERAFREVRNWKQADQAAVESADNYVLAGMTEDAVRINNDLFNSTNDPLFKIKAYTGIAYAYQKAGNKAALAEAVERIADSFPDSLAIVEENLFRAIDIHMQMDSLNQAVRVTDKYLNRFQNDYLSAVRSGSETYYRNRSDQVALNRIELFKKKGEAQGIFEAYGQYADNYTNSPQSVLAYFKRGEYLQQRGEAVGAQAEFEKAIARNNSLPKEKQNAFWTSESLYRLSQGLLAGLKQTPVNLVVKPEAFAASAKAKKKTTSKKSKKNEPVIASDEKVVEYDSRNALTFKEGLYNNLAQMIQIGGYRQVEAIYNAGYTAELMARKYEIYPDSLPKVRNERGDSIEAQRLLSNRVLAHLEAGEFFSAAGNDYYRTVTNLSKAKTDFIQIRASESDSLKITRKKIGDYKDSTSLYISVISQYLRPGTGGAYADSTLETMRPFVEQWISQNATDVPDDVIIATLDASTEKARDKVSEMFYLSGQMKERSIKLYENYSVPKDYLEEKGIIKKKVARKNIVLDIRDLIELAYQTGTTGKYIRPLATQSMEVYERGVSRSRELGLNNDYVKQSEQALLRLATVTVDRADSLARSALQLFDKYDKSYQDQLKETSRVSAQGVIDYTVKKSKMTLALSQSYSELIIPALKEYVESYKQLKRFNAPNDRLRELARQSMSFVYEIGVGYNLRANDIEKRIAEYNRINNEDFSKSWYGDAAVAYDDIKNLCRRVAAAVLGEVITLNDELDDYQDDNFIKSLRALVDIDPELLRILEREGEKADVEKEVLASTDASWIIADTVAPEDDFNWYKKDFKPKDWRPAYVNTGVEQVKYIIKVNDTTFSVGQTATTPIWFTSLAPPAPKPEKPAVDSSGAPTMTQPVPRDTASSAPVTPTPTDTTSATPAPVQPVQPVPRDTASSAPVTPTPTDTTSATPAPVQPVQPAQADTASSAPPTPAPTDTTGKTGFLRQPLKRVLMQVSIQAFAQQSGKDSTVTLPVAGATATDTTQRPADSLVTLQPAITRTPLNVYFRKEFEYSGALRTAQLILPKDLPFDQMELYVNDLLIDLAGEQLQFTFDSTLYAKIDTSRQVIYEITAKLQKGKNVIAAKLPGELKTTDGLKIAIYYSYLGELTDEQLRKLKAIIVKKRRAQKAAIGSGG